MFSLLTRRCLRRGAFASTNGLKAAIQAFIDKTNAEPRPFIWTKTADEILNGVEPGAVAGVVGNGVA